MSALRPWRYAGRDVLRYRRQPQVRSGHGLARTRRRDDIRPRRRTDRAIALPGRRADVCFGGARRNRLLMASSRSPCALYVNTRGAHRPSPALSPNAANGKSASPCNQIAKGSRTGRRKGCGAGLDASHPVASGTRLLCFVRHPYKCPLLLDGDLRPACATVESAGRWAGAAHTATSGTLTFAPGQLWKFVKVPLLDDAIDEGTEYFPLRFSNLQGATPAAGKRETQGLIRNSDPLQGMWLARFGRMVASNAVASATARWCSRSRTQARPSRCGSPCHPASPGSVAKIRGVRRLPESFQSPLHSGGGYFAENRWLLS